MEKPKIHTHPGGNFAGRDLSGQDLAGEDLRGCDFSRANLRGARMNGCRIDGAVFVEADLRDVDWKSESTRHVAATLGGGGGVANFSRANLAGANLTSIDLDRSWFEEAKLDGANINGSLRDTCLRRASLVGADLSYCTLHGTDLERADLTDAHLVAVNLRDANVQGAKFTRVNLTRAKIGGITFHHSQIAGAAFLPATVIPHDDHPVKPAKAINKITAYRAYQALLDSLWSSRMTNATHPEGIFNTSMEWNPSARERDSSGSGVATRGPGRGSDSKLNYYVRCRSKIHCRVLLLSAFDGADVPADVADVLVRGVEILQTKILADEDLARGLIMALKNPTMREALEI